MEFMATTPRTCVSRITRILVMVKRPFTSTGTITAQQIKAARAWLDISQDDLAAKTGVTRRAIQDFENGKRVPQARTLRDLRNALEQSGIEFLSIGERAVGISSERGAEKDKTKSAS
jgi:transcriptional regulator with XRE-family HTH domain